VEIYVNGFPISGAETTVPKPVTIDFTSRALETGNGYLETDVKIFDTNGNNYYWYSSLAINKENGSTSKGSHYDVYSSPYFDDFNKVIEPEAKYGYWYLYMIRINDKENDGKQIEWAVNSFMRNDYYHYKMVTQVDEHYDKYLKTSIQMRILENQTVALNEPVQIYSNVDNGYGIFGANVVSVYQLK
jgi:hypothetical protein